MKRKLAALFGIMLLVVTMLPVSNAYAFVTNFKGMYINPSHDGLRAIISTGSANGSPPNFSFSALSPDIHSQEWDFYMSPSYSCAEAGTMFARSPGGSTVRYFYVYNQCTASFYSQTSLSDATFRSKYVRQNTWNDTGTSFTDENYDLRIIKVNNNPVWGVYLYNYNTGVYDSFGNVGGSNGTNSGGVWFRDYGGTQQETGKYCPTLYAWNVLQFRGIQYRVGTTWYTLASGDTNPYSEAEYCFINNTYKITNPQPYQWKMLPYGASY